MCFCSRPHTDTDTDATQLPLCSASRSIQARTTTPPSNSGKLDNLRDPFFFFPTSSFWTKASPWPCKSPVRQILLQYNGLRRRKKQTRERYPGSESHRPQSEPKEHLLAAARELGFYRERSLLRQGQKINPGSSYRMYGDHLAASLLPARHHQTTRKRDAEILPVSPTC